MLRRAVGSVRAQTYPVDQISISTDHRREGAAANRQRALSGVMTEWVAFLDDDDVFKPQHIEHLVRFAQDTGADYVFPWFEVVGGMDPFPQHFGKVYDMANPTHTTIVTMVKTELAKEVGFINPPGGDGGGGSGEDWDFTLRCIEAGATIMHLPERTWLWSHHLANTSGQPHRW
jgi:glycosyltransferase involved in cell wall biosynthesis